MNVRHNFLIGIALALFSLGFNEVAMAQGFQEDQLRFPRVREAKAAAEEVLAARFKAAGLAWPNPSIYMRAFKQEDALEIWAKGSNGKYVLVHTYEICAKSGELGPKRKEGDRQVPEGFYRISAFNPSSSFHLSLRVNYPNKSDKVLSDKSRPGGDIYIHGNCVTIGCLPMTDAGIEEIYWLCVRARAAGQDVIPISIFPMKMTAANLKRAESSYPAELMRFWQQLEPGYRYFELHRKLPSISFLADGSMRISEP